MWVLSILKVSLKHTMREIIFDVISTFLDPTITEITFAQNLGPYVYRQTVLNAPGKEFLLRPN